MGEGWKESRPRSSQQFTNYAGRSPLSPAEVLYPCRQHQPIRDAGVLWWEMTWRYKTCIRSQHLFPLPLFSPSSHLFVGKEKPFSPHAHTLFTACFLAASHVFRSILAPGNKRSSIFPLSADGFCAQSPPAPGMSASTSGKRRGTVEEAGEETWFL